MSTPTRGTHSREATLAGLATAAAFAAAGDAQAATITRTFDLSRLPDDGAFNPNPIDIDGDTIADFAIGYGALGYGGVGSALGYGALGYGGGDASLGYGSLGYGGVGYGTLGYGARGDGSLGYGGVGDLGYGGLGYGAMIWNADIAASGGRQNKVVVDVAAPYMTDALGADALIGGAGSATSQFAFVSLSPTAAGAPARSLGAAGFVGFEIAAGTMTLHGYLSFGVSGAGNTLLMATYDDTGAPIRTPVPEPGSLALLALGAAGLARLRRGAGAAQG